MNPKAAYLAWVRTTAPETYVAALRKIAKKPRGTGGLTRDLVGSMHQPMTGFGFLGDDSTDLQEVTVTADPISAPDMSQFTVDTSTFTVPDLSTSTDIANIANTTPDFNIAAPAPAAPSSSLFDTIVKSVASLASTAMNTSAQSNLLKVNTTRAQQGLPPVNAAGVVIKPTSPLLAASTNPTIRAIETSAAGVISSPIVWAAGIGLLALILMKKRA